MAGGDLVNFGSITIFQLIDITYNRILLDVNGHQKEKIFQALLSLKGEGLMIFNSNEFYREIVR
jgi:hypothetical protein